MNAEFRYKSRLREIRLRCSTRALDQPRIVYLLVRLLLSVWSWVKM